MSCQFIQKGRKLPQCKNNLGGFKAVGFMEFVEGLSSKLAADESFGSTAATYAFTTEARDVYRYELKNNGNTLDETSSTDPETYNTVFTSELKMVLQKMDSETKSNIKLLAYSRPQIFVETFSGKVILLGIENGSNLTTSVSKVGGSLKDAQGFELSFQTEEPNGFVYLDAAAITAYRNAFSGTDINP